MNRKYILCHPHQYDFINSIYELDDTLIRINYNEDEYKKALKDAEIIFNITSLVDEQKFNNISLGSDVKIVSIFTPYQFYSNLGKYYKQKKYGIELIKNITYNDMVGYPYYSYGLTIATDLALRIGIDTLSCIEFGVFFGRGLKIMSEFCRLITKECGIKFKVFGFDTGEGLIDVKGWVDHAELWSNNDMVMPNYKELLNTLSDNTELILGDIKETLPKYVNTIFDNSTLGFVSLDVDTYHSSIEALNIFTYPANNYLPVIPLWVDDSYINIFQSNYSGEALAIKEFNQKSLRKIDHKIIRTNRQAQVWHHGFWFVHIFDHEIRNKQNNYNLYMNHIDY